jgi:hypothetical protein
MRKEATGERIGSALRGLAEDLVNERRQVLLLRRENKRLREELAQLGVVTEPPDGSLAGVDSEGEVVGQLDVCPHCGQPIPEAGDGGRHRGSAQPVPR